MPGRLNQVKFIRQRPGIYFGQCSEICGANHRFMPIVIEIVNIIFFKLNGLQDANSPIIEELIFIYDFINLILVFIISFVRFIVVSISMNKFIKLINFKKRREVIECI